MSAVIDQKLAHPRTPPLQSDWPGALHAPAEQTRHRDDRQHPADLVVQQVRLAGTLVGVDIVTADGVTPV